MATYSLWAIWKNPVLNKLEREEPERSKVAFHLLWAAQQDYPEKKDIFIGPILIKYRLWCSVMVAPHCKSFNCCSSGKGPPTPLISGSSILPWAAPSTGVGVWLLNDSLIQESLHTGVLKCLTRSKKPTLHLKDRLSLKAPGYLRNFTLSKSKKSTKEYYP